MKSTALCDYIGLVWHQITKNNGTIVKVLWLEETIINNARINSNLRGHPTVEGAATFTILVQKCEVTTRGMQSTFKYNKTGITK